MLMLLIGMVWFGSIASLVSSCNPLTHAVQECFPGLRESETMKLVGGIHPQQGRFDIVD